MPSTALQAAPVSRRPFGQNYAFVVVAVIFLALLASAGLRATPGVLAALRHFERHEDRACEVTLTPLPTTHRPPAALDLPSESL